MASNVEFHPQKCGCISKKKHSTLTAVCLRVPFAYRKRLYGKGIPMEQEEFVPDYAQISRDIWIQQTYEEIKKRTYLDPLSIPEQITP